MMLIDRRILRVLCGGNKGNLSADGADYADGEMDYSKDFPNLSLQNHSVNSLEFFLWMNM